MKQTSILKLGRRISIGQKTNNKEHKKNHKPLTMYIKNRRISSDIKAYGSCQTLCLTENSVLRNRLLFIY